ncbi:high-affinity iron transporter [Paenibacillus phyllosphaerae]|uniref:High-affinity iron transporter n=1 Tax=Paenibacillus phyllosphaerae TaxID=274593 RepID=A0A7W5B479_9BACL|nr:FTR1 family protein [Paenibacillus phyllosphaerae]MBB3113874.1 high-affinity iron transporter [Paenibacillus phyllosphaerae]
MRWLGHHQKKQGHRISVAIMLPVLALLWSLNVGAAYGAEKPQQLDRILPVIGGALVDIGQQKYSDAESAMEEAQNLWLESGGSDLAEDVTLALSDARVAVASASSDPVGAKEALAAAVKVVNAYMKAQDGEAEASGPEAAGKLTPILEQLAAHVQSAQWDAASADYSQLDKAWTKIEQPIRSDNTAVYGTLETSMSMIRIALRAEPPRAEQAAEETAALLEEVSDYAAGKTPEATLQQQSATLAEAVKVLGQAAAQAEGGRITEANDQLQVFIRMWPSVEGEVQLRSSDVYRNIEIQMTEASGYLISEPAETDKALAVIGEMKQQLEPMLEETRYTAFDAGAILLREGLEAILVLAALIAYLNKSGNADKRKWIWSGAGFGLVLSAVMAIVLTYAVSQAISGSAREKIEGFAGLGAVIFMLLVGNWLHNKSNIRTWNAFIDRQIGGALARGSLWSLFAVAALSVFREGAETAIFYVGMAPSISLFQMVLGIAAAIVLLALVALSMIRYSVKLPLRPFFLLASAFIYILVFRFIGESIHSLQVSGLLPAHNIASGVSLGALGIYPTLETIIPQASLVVYLLIRYLSRLYIGIRKETTV